MTHSNTLFNQLTQTVSRHEFEKLASKHHVGQKLRKASRWDQFIAMLMSQFGGRMSLRDIESNMLVQQPKMYHLGSRPIARTTLSRLNEKQPASLYEDLFKSLVSRLSQGHQGRQFNFRSPLISLDSTMIDLSLKIFPWADFTGMKGAMKLSVGLNNSTEIPELVTLGGAKEGDVAQAKRLALPRGSLVVADRAYFNAEWLWSVNNQDVRFVTRTRHNTRYRVLGPLHEDKEPNIISDQRIKLSGNKTRHFYPGNLRLVTYWDEETARELQFVTNDFSLSAQTIADIYRERWRVELFFKAIKQTLKIRAFLGKSRNAVMTQIWIALIAYMLVSHRKFSHRTSWSVLRIMRVVQANIFERIQFSELLIAKRKPDKAAEPQLRFSVC